MSSFFVSVALFLGLGTSSIFGHAGPLVNLMVEKNAQCGVANIIELDRDYILSKVETYYTADIRTVTSDISDRSAGGINDFYSEGDYWWPVDGDY
ncbi:MAG: hypothetical protein CBC09_01250, partial [Cellvibrionales bacterium TMED49]